MERGLYRAEAVLDHLRLVVADRIDHRTLAAIRHCQRATETHCVFERDIGTDTAIRRHRMDRVAQERDTLCLPCRDRHRPPDTNSLALVGITQPPHSPKP